MSGGPSARLLPDGRRLHLQHGPIDLIVEAVAAERRAAEGHAAERRAAEGHAAERRAAEGHAAARRAVEGAYDRAVARFADILPALVGELALLRQPVDEAHPLLRGPVARRMAAAVWPHRARFITPMAAVAGAVADEVLAAMLKDGAVLDRAYVNNGGDIALYLAPGQFLRTGVVADQDHPMLDAVAAIDWRMPVRGIATSGWRGRSLSLGIADAVTVLAATAAEADAAATMVANAVDVDHPAVGRLPARDVRDNSDLGGLLVTVAVGALPAEAVTAALDSGVALAEDLRGAGLLAGALLCLRGQSRAVGLPTIFLQRGQGNGGQEAQGGRR